ncbi:hypothetical protein AAVH_11424 [Aphelenchoides avenae]|nr:hypothetical protein AAVH_11424 [Aphelenchus avenae]
MDVRNDSCTNFIHPLGGDGEHVLHALQVVSSLLTVAFWFVNVFCRRSARLRNLCIHPNLKVILVGSSLFILAHSASTFLLHLENLLVVNAAITAVGFYNADIPQGPRCVLFTKRNAERLVLVIFATMALDLLTIVGDFVLLVWNKKRMTKKLVDYKLAKAYQLQENRMTMRLIVPVAMLHLVTLIVYVALTLTASLSASEEHSDSENFRTFVLYAEGLRTDTT